MGFKDVANLQLIIVHTALGKRKPLEKRVTGTDDDEY